MTYCGCRTRSNRLKWAIAILATIVGLVLIAAAVGKTATDLKDYDDCLKNCQNTGQITASQYDEYKDGPDWNSREDDYADTGIPCVDNCQQKKLKDNVNTIGGLFWGGVAALVIASIPCYIMCCCTPRPDIVHGHAVAVPYSGSAPVATPYQATGPQYQVAQPNAYTYPPSATADPYTSAAPPGYPTNQPAYNYGKV